MLVGLADYLTTEAASLMAAKEAVNFGRCFVLLLVVGIFCLPEVSVPTVLAAMVRAREVLP